MYPVYGKKANRQKGRLKTVICVFRRPFVSLAANRRCGTINASVAGAAHPT
ncbi:hypothetical protein [Kingella potus]|uniref:hypothetical protein n=1 Tax=Kingella potus TaxID=265175 RepID=UPI001FD5842F|nr:hypothetical protein [Kingella potus]UOP01738.1 hypothetical protein LVJ84_06390 [Kingella potus]